MCRAKAFFYPKYDRSNYEHEASLTLKERAVLCKIAIVCPYLNNYFPKGLWVKYVLILYKPQMSRLIGKLISAFVFATRIVLFLYFLNPKFQASTHLLCLYSLVCVGPVQKPHCWFSHEPAHPIFGACLGYIWTTITLR